MAARRTLLVPELTPFNLPFFGLLSFFFNIRVLFATPSASRFMKGRLSPIDLTLYFTPDETPKKRDAACALWEKASAQLADEWRLQWRGKSIDLGMRAKQLLGKSFERMYMVTHILERSNSSLILVDALSFRHLRKLGAADFWTAPVHPLSRINYAIDFLTLWVVSMLKTLKLSGQLLRGLFVRGSLLDRSQIKIIWDAVLYYELSLSKTDCAFDWFVDGKKVRPSEILFLLPYEITAKFRREIESKGYSAYTLRRSYSHVSAGAVARALITSMRLLVHCAFANYSAHQLLMCGLAVEMLRYQPLFDHLAPKLYVECICSIGNEGAHVLYLNSAGVPTVLYCYSANSHSWTSRPDDALKFRMNWFSRVLAKNLLAWHPNYVDFINTHAQPVCKAEVLGPLMSGDESIMARDAKVVRKEMGCPDFPGARFLSVFDVSPILNWRTIADIYPVYYGEKFTSAFLDDIMRLMGEFNNLVLIYKPKRDLVDPRFAYSRKFRDALENLKAANRAVVLKENVNPWLPIRMADICVSMPFTSTILAAAHHGVYGLFHDPMSVVKYHRYGEVDSCITHGYEMLREKIKAYLEKPVPPDQAMWRNFIGLRPGANSTGMLQDYLEKAVGH